MTKCVDFPRVMGMLGDDLLYFTFYVAHIFHHLYPLPPSHPLTCPHPIFVSFILRSMTSSRIPHSQVHVDIISWTK